MCVRYIKAIDSNAIRQDTGNADVQMFGSVGFDGMDIILQNYMDSTLKGTDIGRRIHFTKSQQTQRCVQTNHTEQLQTT